MASRSKRKRTASKRPAETKSGPPKPLKPNGKVAYQLINSTEDDHLKITNLIAALYLIAEGMSGDDTRCSDALYGICNGIEDAMSDMEEKLSNAGKLLRGYAVGVAS
jgi:hypothetical protein